MKMCLYTPVFPENSLSNPWNNFPVASILSGPMKTEEADDRKSSFSGLTKPS